MHVTRALLGAAQAHRDRVALRTLAGEVSYGELGLRIERGMARLAEDGVGRGETVGLLADNHPDVVAWWFAVVGVGATVFPLSTHAMAEELRALRLDAGIARVLADDAHAGRVREAGSVRLDTEGLSCPDGPRAGHVTDPPDGIALWLATSGTTGRSRIARIGHDALLQHTRALQEHVLRFTPEDRVLACLPLAHSFGIRMTALAPLLAGTQVLVAPRFDAEETLALAADFGATWIAGVPTMFARWAEVPGEPLPALRWALSAGAALTEDVRGRAQARLGAPVRQGYGMTEATFCCVDTEGVPGSVGRPVPGVELQVREGHVFVRGPNLMRGYLGAPDHEGWLATGDLGRLDEQGRLFVTGRAKDLVVRGGHNVNPVEVEEVVAAFAGVREVAVVGRPDAELGEELVAVLVAAPDLSLSALETHLRARLPSPKRPREFVVVDALPVGRSRKVLRRVLRAQLQDGTMRAVRP